MCDTYWVVFWEGWKMVEHGGPPMPLALKSARSNTVDLGVTVARLIPPRCVSAAAVIRTVL